MNQSIVRLAAEAFSRGNYLRALDLYRKLSHQMGEHIFHANIQLCIKRGETELGRRDCKLLPLKALKVACIMDEFTFTSYKPECNLLPLTPDNVINELTTFKPDLFFIESAWQGKDDLWNRKIGTLSQELKIALQWCKERQIPTVFWNKEDPIHFETFLTTAQQFDYLFTTDIDCIARYKAALGHERVYLLPFACQPKIHNPVELYSRKDAFCFAGAYYVRYPDRIRDLEDYVSKFPQYKPIEIFDRNFGKNDVNYQFPQKYRPFIIGTLPFNKIDQAYKGYRYSINLNSIKQSQTMFARRVYELLGSNTITVSNFSRGVRLLFGDLVISSDSAKEIIERLRRMDDEFSQKLRLAGLRKVMLEHSYEHRLAYVAKKVLGWQSDRTGPTIIVLCLVNSEIDYQRAIENFKSQHYNRKQLVVVLNKDIDGQIPKITDSTISILDSTEASQSVISEYVDSNAWLSLMSAYDYYGPNYLLDLSIATRHSDYQAIGKVENYQWSNEGIQLSNIGQAYRPQISLASCASIISTNAFNRKQPILPWLEQQLSGSWELPSLAIDPFNYCENGRLATDIADVKARVDDLNINTGISIEHLNKTAEAIPPAQASEFRLPTWDAKKLSQIFGQKKHKQIILNLNKGGLNIQSSLPDGKHEYIYSDQEIPLSALPIHNTIDSHLVTTPGLNIQYVFWFLNEKKEKISHCIHAVNRNCTSSIPNETSYVRIGLRVAGNGTSTIRHLLWGHQKLPLPQLLGCSDTLLLTNHYPSYTDIYRNGFVHSRVKAYQERGVRVDVFRFHNDEITSYHEFQTVDVITAGKQSLHKLLAGGQYQQVLVHFLSPEMWEVLEKFPDIKKIVWVHGAEIQPWHRRDFNYQNEHERAVAQRKSERRITFWRDILQPIAPNLKLVFVSRYFAGEVMEDIGFPIPSEHYEIIHNPIDTKLFSYQVKPVEQRKKILSIRPYASKKYANDLSVQAILELSKKPFFADLEFRMIGNGPLFDEVLQPIKHFSNVIIERRFLTQEEIAVLHKEYGVFLVPTRMDSQGVSRDEAMASGLVPITNAVAAIPEFMDNSCGILAPPENAEALANGIVILYESPELFKRLSKEATQRVTKQTASNLILDQELSLFNQPEARQFSPQTQNTK